VLVADSCGLLAPLVHDGLRGSLVLSILQQLLDDPAALVREAAARNLARLLRLLATHDKFSAVEAACLRLAVDDADQVRNALLKDVVPALVHWVRVAPATAASSLHPTHSSPRHELMPATMHLHAFSLHPTHSSPRHELMPATIHASSLRDRRRYKARTSVF
jgi:hypothetical protein